MSAPRVFDQHHYDLLNRARGEVVSRLLDEIRSTVDLHTAVDVGCGLGYFSALLRSLGLAVTGVDGRKENAAEAARRTPEIVFHTLNAEDPALVGLGRFDLVFCFGLLYHLENPLLAVRHLHAITEKILFVECVVFPGLGPIMALVDEVRSEDQGLNHIAFYPTEACLTKMLYQAGFPFVFELSAKPKHPDFQSGSPKGASRTMLVASVASLQAKSLRPVAEPRLPYNSWNAPERESDPLLMMKRFVKKPFPEKIKSIKRAVKGK